jgi:hypothetical protein
MIRHFCICFCMGLVTTALPVRAAKGPYAGTGNQKIKVWTNDDLEKFHEVRLISFVGQVDEEMSIPQSAPRDYVRTQEPAWYAEQAARLRDELERRRAQLDGYRQAIEDALSLKTMSGGMNLDGGEIGITPEAGIEILEQRVMNEQARIADLEDLARRNDIEPGTLRGQ